MSSDDEVDILSEEGNEAPKAKAAPKKRAPKEAPAGDGAPKPKKPRAPAAPKVTKTTVDAKGWTMDPPNLIYKDFGSKPCAKIASFDMDGTLIRTKSGSNFAKHGGDWIWLPGVTTKLKALAADGYKLVIFSNQGGIKSALAGKAADTAKEKVDAMIKDLGVPALVMMATMKDEMRKGSGTGMWDRFASALNGGVAPDLSSSFFVGDAAGRPTDFVNTETNAPSETDKKFAKDVGIEFKLPEEVFGSGGGSGGDGDSNVALIAVFDQLAAHFKTSGGDKDHFKAHALAKVAVALLEFPHKITSDNLKEVGKLKGVGKGSMATIEEFVSTGKCTELDAIKELKAAGGSGAAASPAPAGPPPPPKTKAAEMAFKFM